RKGGKLFRTVLIRIDTIGRTSDRVMSVPVGNAGITGSLFKGGISYGKFRPELSNVLSLARVDITATFIASLVLAGKGFRTSVHLVLYRFRNFIIGSSDVIALPTKMNAQSLPYDTLFKKIDLFIIQLAVALCVLLDVFQREGNI